MSRTATAGIYNFGAGVPGAALDRAVGFISTGVAGTARPSSNLYTQLQNTSGSTIESFTVAYNVEKYRRGSNPAGFRIQLFYSLDDSTWTPAGETFRTFFAPETTNTGYPAAPGITVGVTGTLDVPVPAGGSLYLAWNYSVAEGTTTTNAQALAIDNVSITAAGGETPSIVVEGALQNFSTLRNTPSASQSYTVSAQNLTAPLAIAAPTGFQIRTGSNPFASSIEMMPSGGSVAPTSIDVRLSGNTVGNFAGAITHSTSDAGTVNVPVTGVVGDVYTWQPTSGTASWTTATNWSPARATPTVADVLRFDRGGSSIANQVPSQVIGQLIVTSTTTVALRSASAQTLSLEGSAGADLQVAASSRLNLDGTSALVLELASEATASIAGTIALTNAAHRLSGDAAGAITFAEGSTFIAGTGLTGNPFVTNSEVPAGTVTFASGSVYVRRAGTNPVGTAPVAFSAGSTYRHELAAAPTVAGLTYPNVEFNIAAPIALTGSAPWLLGALTVTQGTVSVTDPLPITAAGNVSVSEGQAFVYNAAATLTLAGTSAQTIGGSGTLTLGPEARLAINNPAGITLARPLRVQRTLILADGSFASNDLLTLSASAGRVATISNAGGSLTGTVSYERVYSHPESNWRLLGSPFEGVPFTTLNGDFHTQGAAEAMFTHGQPILFDYDPSQPVGARWRPLPSYANTAEAARGYIFYMFEDRVDGGPPHLPGTWTIEGQENAPVLNRPLYFAEGGSGTNFNLVSNPLAGHLDWLTVRENATNIGTTYYVWDPALGSTGAYRTYQGLKGFTEAGRYIPPFQAFWVVTTGPGASISFTEAMKDNQQSPPLLGRPEAVEVALEPTEAIPSGPQAWFTLEVTGSTLAATPLLAFFYEDAFPEADPVDAPWLQSLSADRIDAYFADGSRRLVTAARPYGGAEQQLPLHIASSRAGTYTLTWPQWHDVPDDWAVTLVDHETGNLVDLRAQDAYTFVLGNTLARPDGEPDDASPLPLDPAPDADPDTDPRGASNRFSLVVSPAATTTESDAAPTTLAITSAHPNPFLESVTVRYSVPETAPVELTVYDVLGREVTRLLNETVSAGDHTLRWDASGLPSGVYLLRLSSPDGAQTLRLVRTR